MPAAAPDGRVDFVRRVTISKIKEAIAGVLGAAARVTAQAQPGAFCC